MSNLPAPFVPADVDLRHFPSMSIDVVRLRDSRFAASVSGEAFRCGLLLWCAAWHQVPAGTLPADDVELSALAGFGRALAAWREHREGALYGWVLCSDGRLHHRVLAEKAIEAWNSTLFHRWRKEVDRIRKENKVREERGLFPLENPAKPLEIRVSTPTPSGSSERMDGHGEGGKLPETPGPTPDTGNGEAFHASSQPVPAEARDFSGGNPAENALNGTERNGESISCPKRAPPDRTRKPYPEDFERFWRGYPTDPNMSKADAGRAWSRMTDVDRLSATAAVPEFVAYCRKDPTYRPVHAVKFLTSRRFEGFLTAKAATTAAEHVPRVDLGPAGLVAEATVVDVIRRGGWIDGWGPGIGKPGCRVPNRLIEDARRTAA
ncbi:DUF1376 domain-containing protein [Lichenibacterium dinghuense]|uniref:DUF1376 domain-containing protein n=1 Tax=Lichenibacterium dinghuense TaxID=2895977 RepID=UPI001F1E8FE5|nr:DUF1376 domain-containing protein [Lichenibacterium sp. 6Y81]